MVYYGMPIELTKKQTKVLAFIEEFAAKQGFPPTLTEIADDFGLSIGTVQDHVEALKRKGFLRHKPNTARGLLPARKITDIPVYGRVAAGTPTFAVENMEGYWNEPDGDPSDFFALKVTGDSMTGAGIEHGDILKIRKQNTANDKDIVVALVGEEATVKRFRKKHGAVFLEPANPKYSVINGVEFTILGKVVALKRSI